MLRILKELANISKEHLYLVGGCVRNYLLFGDFVNTDKDICGALPATEMFDGKVNLRCINERLGTYKIFFDNEEFEYTPFRAERYIGGRHSPEEVVFGCDLYEDALRRDFTVNAIYYDLTENKVVDPLSAVNDVHSGIIRQVSENTLLADGLRLMRAVRFAAQLGFSIEDKTMDAIKSNAHLIKDIVPERIKEELMKILTADIAYGVKYAQYRGLELLKESLLLSFIIPELQACDGVKQNPKYHLYDVLEHIFQTVKFSASDIRLAALFHDVAKPLCLDSAGHMKGHDIIGSEMTRTIMNRLRFSKAETDEVCMLVRLHMFDLKGEASDSKVKLFVVHNFDYIDKIIELKQADAFACGFEQIKLSDRLANMKAIILSDGTPIRKNELQIDGEDIVSLGAKGALIGEILESLHRDCILMPKLNKRDWLLTRAQKMVNINKFVSNKI